MIEKNKVKNVVGLFGIIVFLGLPTASFAETLSRIQLVEEMVSKLSPNDVAPVSAYADRNTLTPEQRRALDIYTEKTGSKSGNTVRFSPNAPATNAQAAVMLHRWLNKADIKMTPSKLAVSDINTVKWSSEAFRDLIGASVISPVVNGNQRYIYPKQAIERSTAKQWIAAADSRLNGNKTAQTKAPVAPAVAVAVAVSESVSKQAPTPSQKVESAVSNALADGNQNTVARNTDTNAIVRRKGMDTGGNKLLSKGADGATAVAETVDKKGNILTRTVASVKGLFKRDKKVAVKHHEKDRAKTTTVAQMLKQGEANLRIYGGLTLGPSPYQTDQSESLREGTDYINANQIVDLGLSGRDSEDEVEKEVGVEQGFEFDYKPANTPFHLVFNYGYSRVSKYDDPAIVNVPDLIYQNGAFMYRDDLYPLVSNNLPAVQIHKRSHATRFGLRQYLKFEPVIKSPEWYHVNSLRKYVSLFYGAGIALVADQVRGVAVKVPEQVIPTLPTGVDNTSNVTDPVIRSFNYNHTQLGVYAEVGAMVKSPELPIHIGVQARFQENPMDMTVDAAGEKLLGRSRSLIGTVFGGISF